MINVLILTNDGHILKVSGRNVTVQSPFRSIWKKFGLDMKATEDGYPCNGYHPSENHMPKIGTNLFLWLRNRLGIFNTNQVVRRIYEGPVKVTPADLVSILRKLDYDVRSGSILTSHSNDYCYNRALWLILFSLDPNKKSWKLNKFDSDLTRIFTHNLATAGDYKMLLDCELITEDFEGLITISDALIVLWMEAIHEARPMATQFDAKGILEYVSPK